MKTKRKYYSSCEFLPLWNFFKLTDGQLKHLIVLKDRMDYEDVQIDKEEQEHLQGLWEKIFAEYNSLDTNFGAVNFLSDKVKIVYFYSKYVQEQSLLKSLLYRTNVNHLQQLRNAGYEFNSTTQGAYWESLYNNLKKVENHLTYIQIVKNKIDSAKKDSKNEGNPFDSIMAWIASNNIEVKEDITVSRYIKIKAIILQKQKSKKQQESKSRLHGWAT